MWSLQRNAVRTLLLLFFIPGWLAVIGEVTDVDECDRENEQHDCDENAYCFNAVGSFTCSCNCGYTGNGTSCIADAAPVGVGNPGIIPDRNFRASSYDADVHRPMYGRLHDRRAAGWCALSGDSFRSQYLEVDLGKLTTLVRIATQGIQYLTSTKYILQYHLNYSIDGTTWIEYTENGKSSPKLLQGNMDAHIVVCHELYDTYPNPLQARYVRIRPWTYISGACMRFELYGDSDECSLGISSCHSDATCTNTPGSYTCHCKQGFTGNGTMCNDIDECTLELYDCPANTFCTNFEGSYGCNCNSGYTGDGGVCTDIDECAERTHTCHGNTTCVNVVGSYSCVCQCSLPDPSTDNCTSTVTVVQKEAQESSQSLVALVAGSLGSIIIVGIASVGFFSFRSRRRAAVADLMSTDEHVVSTKTESVETYHSIEELHTEDYISLRSFTSDVISVGPENAEHEDSMKEAMIAEIISVRSLASDGTATDVDRVETDASMDESIVGYVISVESSSGTILGSDSEQDDLSLDESSITDEISASSFSSASTPIGSVVTEADESVGGSSLGSEAGTSNASSDTQTEPEHEGVDDQASESAAQNEACPKSAASRDKVRN